MTNIQFKCDGRRGWLDIVRLLLIVYWNLLLSSIIFQRTKRVIIYQTTEFGIRWSQSIFNMNMVYVVGDSTWPRPYIGNKSLHIICFSCDTRFRWIPKEIDSYMTLIHVCSLYISFCHTAVHGELKYRNTENIEVWYGRII